MKYFIKYVILKTKSATDRRLGLEFYVSQGPTAYRYGDTIKILTYLRYSINRLQYKTEHILKEIKAVLGFDILHRFYIPTTKHFTFL